MRSRFQSLLRWPPFGPPRRRPLAAREGFLEDLLALAGTLASEVDFGVRMERLCEHTRSMLDCDRSSLFLREVDRYAARFNAGNPPEIAALFPDFRVRLDDPLISQAVRTRGVVTVNDARHDPRTDQIARRAGIRSIVVASIFDRGQQSIGFLTAEFNQRDIEFGDDEIRLFGALTNIITLALEREQAAVEQAAVAARLEQANQMASLGRFARALAHDFNDRLTSIVGISDLLIEESRGTDTEAMLEELVRSVEGATELTQHLLEISGERPVATPASDVGLVFRSIGSFLRPLVRSDVELVVSSEVRSAFAPLSDMNLRRVLWNLVMNAANASRAGDTIRVLLAHATRAPAAPATSPAPAAGAPGPGSPPLPDLVITVEDEGSGIDELDRHRIFEPFYSTHPDRSGLGLSVVSSLVEAAGGRIEIDSPPQGGTVVRLTIPEVEAPSADSVPPEQIRSPLDRRVTVLIVDDDEPVRRIIRRAIERQDHVVLEAVNGTDALGVAAEADPPIDVLITDVVMPEMDGIELARRLVARNDRLRVIFTSGYAPDFRDRLGSDVGEYVFLPKPFGPSRVVHELETLVARSAPLH